VWLFTAQVGGLALNESLRRGLWPVIWQMIVAAPLVWWVVTSGAIPTTRHWHVRPLSAIWAGTLWCVSFASLAVVCVIPVVLIGQGTFQGLARVVQNTAQFQALLREIFIGTVYALAAALASAMIAAWLLRAAQASRLALAGIVVMAIPGLFGSLVLGLALIQLFQQPYLRILYKTPLALMTGMVLFLMPRAVVVRLLLWSTRQTAGAHLATLLHGAPSRTVRDCAHELLWQMRWRGEIWSGALLAWWAFLDLTIVYLLAPVTIVSAPVMLYNQMHFGRNSVLSALVFLTVAVPALLFATALAGRRLLFRWFWR
jgi:ABC-type Fe3+ transport system permease subunit